MSDLQAAIAAYHRRRFPLAKPEHVALKLAEEAGELASAVNGMVSQDDYGKGDVVAEAVDVAIVLLSLVGRVVPRPGPDCRNRSKAGLVPRPSRGPSVMPPAAAEVNVRLRLP